MKKLYRFSPIENEETLEKGLVYITQQLEELSYKFFKQHLPITTLKVFPHYFEEYQYLHDLISKTGPEASFSSDTSLYVEVSKKVENYDIKYLGVRIVDPYRMQVGCGDYEIDNFEQFKRLYETGSPYIRSVDTDMLEIWHPDFDILGYVVPVI